MTTPKQQYPRGAEWRLWDLHIHTPASYQWNGGKPLSQMTAAERTAALDDMIKALNDAAPAVFALMDYWTFDGWFALQKRLVEPGAPKLNKTVLPGIELRLVAPMDERLNAHVVFAEDVPEQDLKDFLSKLQVGLIRQPLSSACLIRYAREHIQNDRMKKLGYDPAQVAIDDALALQAGSKDAQILTDSYRDAIREVPGGKAVGFMPWDTNDGLAQADWQKHYAYVLDLMQSSPIFETRNPDLWSAFTGIETDGNKKWIGAFQNALKNTPRLAVSGSDAHRYADYGRYPNGKATWIKADPTFLGLLQAIKEPAMRSFLGDQPGKLAEIASYNTYYIDQVGIDRESGSTLAEHWLHGCSIPLNPDLTAIIGNKGSGKSALADVIALLGNSRQLGHFSFLSKTRFRAKPKELARHFRATITWADQSSRNCLLSEDPAAQAAEMIRYIPQAHFEKLCNDHVSGDSDVFEKELRAVIFSHADASIRQGALDFGQLIEMQEGGFRDRLAACRADLHRLNLEIEAIEGQMLPENKKKVQEILVLKERQMEEHEKIKPGTPPPLPDTQTPEQAAADAALKDVNERIKKLDQDALTANTLGTGLAAKLKAVQSIRDRLRLLERAFRQFQDDTATDLKVLGLSATQLVSLQINEADLNQVAGSAAAEQAALATQASTRAGERAGLVQQAEQQAAKLNEPQQRYQKELQALETWQARYNTLVGDPTQPESLEGLKARIKQFEALPAALAGKQADRLRIAGEIYEVLDAQRLAREKLFAPVQNLIRSNRLIRDEYKLQFQATLSGHPDTLSAALFDIVRQGRGEFRGEEESYAAVRKVAELHDLNQRSGALDFIQELYSKLESTAGGAVPGIAPLLRRGHSSAEVYDLLFGLNFLEPRYTLRFQDAQIAQLSPGQRGALLLIFYLLVDKERTPIILDQPEENLDNETVVSLLVPVLTEAKKRRQIIMVTHNPNLAVVCDAEQVIYSTFERKTGPRIEYTSGSIENPAINKHVVNVLEGTKRAFNNRRGKYHE